MGIKTIYQQGIKKTIYLIIILLIVLSIILTSNISYSQEKNTTLTNNESSEVNYSQNNTNQQDTNKNFMVQFDHEALFILPRGIGIKSVEERANKITEALKMIAKNENISIDLLKIKIEEDKNLIVVNDILIMTVTNEDAQLTNNSIEDLSKDYLEIFQKSISQYRKERSIEYLRKSFLYTIISTIICLIILFIFNKTLPNFYKKIRKNIKFKNDKIGIREKITDGIFGALKTSNLAINLAVIYIYIGLVSNFFPWTKGIGKSFKETFVSGSNLVIKAILSYLPNLSIIIFIILISYYILKFIKPIFIEIEKGQLNIPGFYPEWSSTTYKLLEIVIICLTGVMMVPYLPGFGSPAFQGISIFVGVLFSLGSTAAVSNAVAGIILIYTRAFQIGDRVKISDTLGDIEEKTLIVTRIRTFENIIITIPNAILLATNIINYTASIRDTKTPVMLTAVVTLGYDVPWELIYNTLTQAALNTTHILKDPSPFVLQTSLGDFSVTYELKAHTNEPGKMETIYSELHQNMQDQCNENDIEILSPIYSAIRDGNYSTIPESYLPNDYQTPAFQINPFNNLSQIDFNLKSQNNQNNNP